MLIPFLTTKLLIPPSRSRFVPRHRLLDRLDGGVDAKLTAVLAPAGFGKTTLITSWIRHWLTQPHQERVAAWLSLDENDNDFVNFLSYVVASLQTIDERVGETTITLLNGTALPPVENPLVPLLNDIANLPCKTVLVLDDYHLITNSEIHQGMTYLIEHLPPQLHLVIISRETLPFPLHRMRVRDQVVEISVQELRFTQGEAADFLRQVMQLDLSSDFVQTLEKRTEGWIAGLQMAALSLRARTRPGHGNVAQAVQAFGGKHRYVIDYLAEEVMRQQSDEMRQFLLETAVLDRFSASLCQAVTGEVATQTLLTQLDKANLFLINLDDQRQWYRYHHLFADYLRSQLSEEDAHRLHQKASDWYEAHNFIPEAIRHAIAANNIIKAEQLIEQSSEQMGSSGRLNLILSLINALPPDVVEQNSYFATLKGWILYLRGEREKGEYYAALAQANLSDTASLVHRGTVLGFQAELANNRGDPTSAITFASQAITCLAGTDSFFHTTAYVMLAEAQRLAGDRINAIETFQKTIAYGRQRGHHLITGKALWYLALLLFFQGRRLEALTLCQQAAIDYLDDDGQPTPVAGFIHVPLGVLYYEANQLSRAQHHLELGLELCQQLGMLKYTLIGHYTLARIYFAQQDADTAFQMLHSAQQIAHRLGHVEEGQLMASAAVDLHLRLNNVAAAWQWAEAADFPLQPDVALLDEWVETHPERVCLSYVRLLLASASEQLAVAEAILQKLEDRVVREQRNGRLMTIYILQSLLLTATNKQTAANSRLKQAVRLAAPENYHRSFLDEALTAPMLLAHMQTAPAFVTALINDLTRVPTTTAQTKTAPLQNTPKLALSERELEIMMLVAAGGTNKAVAEALHLTTGTIKWYLNGVYRKLGVSSRTQAVARAREMKLL